MTKQLLSLGMLAKKWLFCAQGRGNQHSLSLEQWGKKIHCLKCAPNRNTIWTTNWHLASTFPDCDWEWFCFLLFSPCKFYASYQILMGLFPPPPNAFATWALQFVASSIIFNIVVSLPFILPVSSLHYSLFFPVANLIPGNVIPNGKHFLLFLCMSTWIRREEFWSHWLKLKPSWTTWSNLKIKPPWAPNFKHPPTLNQNTVIILL